MKKLSILNKMINSGALAVVRAETFERADEIAQGCIKGNIPVMEMSYTLNNAGDLIRQLKDKYKEELICGAGTVLDAETARHAILNGADFIIAPNFDEGVARMCNRYQIPYAPGCSTLSECVDALSAGADFVKAFPISDFYGPKLCKIYKTPLPQLPIMASGGINLTNLEEWLSNGVDICCFGGLLTKGNTDQIAENAAKIHEIIKQFREGTHE